MKRLFPNPISKASLASTKTMKADSQPTHPVMVMATRRPVDRIRRLRRTEMAVMAQATNHHLAVQIPVASKAALTVEWAEATNKYQVTNEKSPQNSRGFFVIANLVILIIVTFTFIPLTALVIAMTGQTGVRSHRVGMAGAAGCATVIDACSFFVHAGLRVRHIEPRRYPGRRAMTILTIRSECAQMESRICVTGDTLR